MSQSMLFNLNSQTITQFRAIRTETFRFLFNPTNKCNELLNNSNRSLFNQLKLKYFTIRTGSNGPIYNLKNNLNSVKKTKNVQLTNQLKCFNSSNKPSNGEATLNTQKLAEEKSLSIFKRFKEAYKQHGKILIWCHVITCCGWITGFFFLSKG